MGSFTVVAKATKSDEFEELSATKILTRTWREQFQPLMTKVLEANFFDCNYPDVEVEITGEENIAVEMIVTNTGTDECMKLLWPRLAEDGELEFVNLSYCLKVAQGHKWTLNFIEGGFSASATEFENNISRSDVLEIQGWFTSMDALDKQQLIRHAMLNKMDMFFSDNNVFSPDEVMDVLCESLEVKAKDFRILTVSMGLCDVIKFQDGEIKQAIAQYGDYMLTLNFQHNTTYESGNFVLCEQSAVQRYRVNFQCGFNYEEEAIKRMRKETAEAKDAIIAFLHCIARYNESIKK